MLETMNVTKQLHPETLQSLKLFEDLSFSQLQRMAAWLQVVSKDADEVIFQQGEMSELYVLLNGIVKIEMCDSSGKAYKLAEARRGDLLGEIAMLRGSPARVTATAVTQVSMLVLDRTALLIFADRLPPDQAVEIFLALDKQTRSAMESGFREILIQRTWASQREVEKQRALTQMVAGVAHEINTPLAVINTAVNLMARDLAAAPAELTAQRAAEIAESLELMRVSVERANQLMNNLKNMSVSHLADEKNVYDIARLVQESMDLIDVNLKRSRIMVRFENKLPPGKHEWFGYQGLFSQVLINLLNNVERYAYPEGAGGMVDVSIDMQGHTHYVLTVRDYGRGISDENQAHIFEPFFTTGKSIGGTGLGLSIVSNIVVNALKGEVEVKSAEGKGSEFVVLFPTYIPD